MLETSFDDFPELFRLAGWAWLAYLALLLGVDAALSPTPASLMWHYYLVNGLLAALFIAAAYGLEHIPAARRWRAPLLVGLITLPILVNRLWPGPLPHGPMSNIEGQTLRLLPVLFIGLVLTAWQYPWPAVALYALGTALLEIGSLWLLPAGDPTAVPLVTFVAVVRTVSFLVVGYFIRRLIQRLQEQQRALAQANARLAQYAGTVEQLTLSRERNRLARELHDTLAHSLSALSVQLETIKAYWDVQPETARGLLDGALASTRTGLSETRRAIKALRASPLDDLGLRLALERAARDAAARGNFALHLSLPDSLPVLPADVEQTLYRIAQEALENVVRHARARQVTVSLDMDDGLRLEIADDGTGFDPQAVPAGRFGLDGMRERAAAAGARLDVDSRPGGGTRICLTLKELIHAD